MEIILANNAGVCKGVERAVKLALSAKEKPVYLLGNIANNERIIGDLAAAGCLLIDEKDVTNLKHGSVVIRAHGIGRTLFEKIKKTGVDIIDATCPKVAQIHEIVEKLSDAGYTIIIIGDKTHPEVVGTSDHCKESIIIGSMEDAENARFFDEKKYAVICQTTFSESLSNNIIIYLKNKLKTLVINNTICYTTRERQREAEEMSRVCDAILVVGSHSSSNTCKLFDICKKNCGLVYLIQNASEINDINFAEINKVGVTAGASTPKELIMEVLSGMNNETENKAVNATAADAAATRIKKGLMDAALEQMREVKEGQRLKVAVIKADEKGIIVTGNGKKDGFIAADKVTEGEYNPVDYPTGMEFYAVVIPNAGNKEYIALDKIKYDTVEADDKALLDGAPFELKIEKAVKGGLIGKKGTFTVFVPASHIDVHRVSDEKMAEYEGKKLLVKKLADNENEEASNNKRHRIVASHKEIVFEERRALKEQRDKEWAEKLAAEQAQKVAVFEANADRFEVNNIVPGKVKRFADFGAFVEVYGFDCLAPNREISWIKGKEARDVLEIGKEYEFVIIKVDPEQYKVSLSYKLTQKRPIEIAMEKYPVGSVVKGKVQSLVAFGAFISVEEGVDGLVHVSNISDKRVNAPSDVLKVGDEVEAKVISYDKDRMSLSIKDANAPTVVEEVKDGDDKKSARATARVSTKGKKTADSEVSKEEQEILDSYSGAEKVSNNVFGDLLKGVFVDDEPKKKTSAKKAAKVDETTDA